MELKDDETIKLLFDLLETTLFNVRQLKELKQLSKKFGIAEEKISEFMRHIISYLVDVLESQKKKLPKFIYKFFITYLSNNCSNHNQIFNERNTEEKDSEVKHLKSSLIQRDELLKKIAKRLNIIHKKIAN
jgi:hypothetical protein